MKALAAAAIIALVACLLLGIQHFQVIALEGQVMIEAKSKDDAIAANTESQATITTLRVEAQCNAAYTADLNKRIAVADLDSAIAKAVGAAKDTGLPQGLVVSLLHGHAQVQTNIMVS